MNELAKALEAAFLAQPLASVELTKLTEEEGKQLMIKNGYFIVEALEQAGLVLEVQIHGIHGSTLLVYPKQKQQ